MLDEEILVEAALSREGWNDPQRRLDAVMRRAADCWDATAELNDYFDSQCAGILVPERWRWVGDRLEGQFTANIRAGIAEWANWAGDRIVRAELGSEDVAWVDCRVYAHRFIVWGYLDYVEMLGFPNLVADFRP